MLVSAMKLMKTPGPRNTAPVEVWMAVMISGVTPPIVAPAETNKQTSRQHKGQRLSAWKACCLARCLPRLPSMLAAKAPSKHCSAACSPAVESLSRPSLYSSSSASSWVAAPHQSCAPS